MFLAAEARSSAVSASFSACHAAPVRCAKETRKNYRDICDLTDATHSSATAKQQVPEFNFNVHQQLTYSSVKSSTVFVVLHDELVYAYPLVETDSVPEAVSLETRVDTLSARRLVALVAVSTQLVRR